MSSLLSRAHNHLQAVKLRELLSSCPLVLVYQTLGNVRPEQLASSINSSLQGQQPQLKACSVKIKNTIAVTGAPGTAIAHFFQANSVLLGWQSEQSASSSLSMTTIVKRADPIQEVFSASSKPTLQTAASTTIQQPENIVHGSLQHKDVTKAIDVSLKLPDTAPVALLAGFYRGQHFRVSHLKEWASLDDSKVYPKLLAEIDSAAEALCEFDCPCSDLLDTLDSLQPAEVISWLDNMADIQSQGGDAQLNSSPASV